MASSMASHQQSIEELVTCPICMERMESPKHLNCQHAFCMACLQDWIQQPGNSPRSISCPVCRKTTPIASGVQHLPTDINVIRLIDVLNASIEGNGSGDSLTNQDCDMPSPHKCSHDNCPAAAHCEVCQDHLCAKCIKVHRSEPALSNHFIRMTSSVCPLHPNKSLDYFCPRCKNLVCSVCVHGPHNRHGAKTVASIAKRNKEMIDKLSRRLSEKVAEERQRHLNNNTEENMTISAVEIESLIENQAAKSRKAIENWQNCLMSEINNKREECQLKISERENHLTVCDGLLTFIENFLRPGSDQEIVSSFLNLRERLTQAQSTLESYEASFNDPSIKEVVFVAETMPSSLGHLSTKTEQEQQRVMKISLHLPLEPSPTSPSSPVAPGLYPDIQSSRYQPPPTAPPSAPDPRHMNPQPIPHLVTYGFDAMDNSWFTDDFSISRKLHNDESVGTSFGHAAVGFIQWMAGNKDEEAQAPVDVAIDNNRGYLYTISRGWFTPGTVNRYDFPGDNDMAHPKIVMNDLSAYVLAINQSDGTIAAAVNEKLYLHTRGIIPDRKQPPDLIPVEQVYAHTVRTPRGLAITNDNTWIVTDNVYSVVGIYRSEGSQKRFKHIRTFGCRGDLPGEFQNPTNVCCDEARGRIIVADSGNHRIQAFDMRGEFLWSSGWKGKNQGEFISPHGLCLDGAGNILVADTGNKRIQILSCDDGRYLKSISTDVSSLGNIAPHNIALYSPMQRNYAYLVIAGLNGRMPVVSMWKYKKANLSSSSSRGYGRQNSGGFVYL